MKNALAILAACTLGFVALSANAQRIDRTGFYAGLHMGYAAGAVEETPDFSRPEAKPKGALLGAQLGYSKQFSNVVLGLEADLRLNNASGSRSAEICPGCVGYSNVETTTTKLGWSGSTRIRLGYALNRFMPYVTGGVAFASVKTTTSNAYVDSVNKVSGTNSSAVTRGAVGSVFGFGAEYAVTNNLMIGAEYRRENFTLEKNSGNNSGTRDLVNNIGLVTASYRF